LDLARLLIYKFNNDSFQIITAGGSVVKISKSKLDSLFTFIGIKYDHFISINNKEISLIQRYIDLNILFWNTEEVGPLYNYEQVKKNIENFENGACSLSNLLIAITNECNYSCDFCYRKEYLIAKIPKDESIYNAISDAKKLGAVAVGFTGGNPILDWKRVGRFAKQASILKYSMIKVSFKSEVIDQRILEYWKESGVNLFRISIEHFYLTDKLKKLIYICRENNIKLEFAYTVYSNHHDLSSSDFWEYLKINNIPLIISPYVPVTHFIEDDVYHYNNIMKKMKEITRKYSCEIRGGAIFSSKKNSFFCNGGLCYCFIESNGNVSGCPLLAKEKSVGNIDKLSLFEIWSNSDWSFYRESLNELKCYNCQSKNSCVGFCKAMALYKESKCKESATNEKIK